METPPPVAKCIVLRNLILSLIYFSSELFNIKKNPDEWVS